MTQTLAGWPRVESPYHAGEQAVQARAGVRERAERAGRRMIRDFMPDQHRELFERLPYLLVGSIDDRGRPWASILVGWPGFIATPDARTMTIAARPAPGDPLAVNLRPGAPVGLLGIELDTRRRNRMNGTVTGVGAGSFSVRVGQSFGNCPQYIQARAPSFAGAAGHDGGRSPGSSRGPIAVSASERDRPRVRYLLHCDRIRGGGEGCRSRRR